MKLDMNLTSIDLWALFVCALLAALVSFLYEKWNDDGRNGPINGGTFLLLTIIFWAGPWPVLLRGHFVPAPAAPATQKVVHVQMAEVKGTDADGTDGCWSIVVREGDAWALNRCTGKAMFLPRASAASSPASATGK